MVKVAVLYADQATIYNTDVAILVTSILDLKSEIGPALVNSLLPNGIDDVDLSQRWFEPAEEIRRAEKSGLLDIGFRSFVLAYSQWVLDQPPAADAKYRITRNSNHLRQMEASKEWLVEAVGEAYHDLTLSALARGFTYPFVDREIGDPMKRFLEASEPGRNSLQKGREIQLATDLTTRLPNFEAASVDELLDIRRELQRPLIYFRSEVIKLAEQISSAPWDKDFPNEAERLIRRDVEPAILHLEDEVKSNTYLSKLAYKSLKDPLEVGGTTGLGFLLGSFGGAAISFLGAAAGVGVSALDVYREWQEKKKEIERNQVYFYYEAGELLRRSQARRSKPR